MLSCRRVYGNMMGDAEDDSGSLDSDSDLILDGDAGAVASGKAIPFAHISISHVSIPICNFISRYRHHGH